MKNISYKSVNEQEFWDLVDQGWKIIDVRSQRETTYLRVLPNSINIPYPNIIDQMNLFFPNKDEKLIMVCNMGNRSSMTAKAYFQNGYQNVYVLANGIEGLKN